MLLLLIIGLCLFQNCDFLLGKTFPDPQEIYTASVYQNQYISANDFKTYQFSVLTNFINYKTEISNLSTNCDITVYEYDSTSNKFSSQTSIGYSNQSGTENESVAHNLYSGIEYLLVVEEKDGNAGSFTVYIGP